MCFYLGRVICFIFVGLAEDLVLEVDFGGEGRSWMFGYSGRGMFFLYVYIFICVCFKVLFEVSRFFGRILYC